MLKKIFLAIGLIIGFIVVFVLFYLLVEFCLSRISVHREADAKPEMAIFIITNGDHTDIVMPIRNQQMDWSKEIKFSNTVLKDTAYQYIAIGWGDKGFYLETPTWSQLKFSVAFKAVFG